MNNYKGIYNIKLLLKDIAKILDCSIDKAYRIINQRFSQNDDWKRYYISQDEFEKWVKKLLVMITFWQFMYISLKATERSTKNRPNPR